MFDICEDAAKKKHTSQPNSMTVQITIIFLFNIFYFVAIIPGYVISGNPGIGKKHSLIYFDPTPETVYFTSFFN